MRSSYDEQKKGRACGNCPTNNLTRAIIWIYVAVNTNRNKYVSTTIWYANYDIKYFLTASNYGIIIVSVLTNLLELSPQYFKLQQRHVAVCDIGQATTSVTIRSSIDTSYLEDLDIALNLWRWMWRGGHLGLLVSCRYTLK